MWLLLLCCVVSVMSVVSMIIRIIAIIVASAFAIVYPVVCWVYTITTAVITSSSYDYYSKNYADCPHIHTHTQTHHFLHNTLEQFTANSLDMTSCSLVFFCDISEDLTCI